MRYNLAVGLLALATLTSAVPIPQGAGVGAGCDAIASDADTGSGTAVQEAGTNAASLVTSTSKVQRRQGAGVGAGCNALFSDADTGSGTAVQEAGQNAAALAKSTTRRQLNRIGAGTSAVVDVVDPSAGGDVDSQANTLDGDGTSDSATVGQQVGATEVQTGQEAGNLVPSKNPARRQLNRIGAGTSAVVDVVDPTVGGDVNNQANTLDGDGTSDSATVGQQAGATEVQTGQEAGNLVPSKNPARRQLNRVGAGASAVVDDADPTVGGDIDSQANQLDGDGTSDSATVGQQVGATEVQTGQEAGDLVPSKVPS